MILRKRQALFVERSIAALNKHKNSLGIAPTGCHAKGTPILMYNGEIKHVDAIAVSEQLMGPDSQPRTVLALHRGQDELFEVVPVKGDPFVVNKGHILSVMAGNETLNLSVRAYLEQPSGTRDRYQLYRAAIDFPEQPEPSVNPWDMGILFSSDRLTEGCARIPNEYKLASRMNRHLLLAGLIDGGGYRSGHSVVIYHATQRMANDIAFIARSLGFLVQVLPEEIERKSFGIKLTGPFTFTPVRHRRKRPGPVLGRTRREDPLLTHFSLRSVGRGDYFGFSVDGDHLYCLGDFTVTHNSGKTIMLSAVTGNWLNDSEGKACVLAHRDELTSQNQSKFLRVNPTFTTSVINAQEKSWAGQVAFAMVQTLSQEKNLQQIPALDLLVVDEAHHVAANSYQRIIERVQAVNPNIAIYGVTATPERSDCKSLRSIFSNVADQITLSEMIASGHLVRPRTFDIDLGQRAALSTLSGSTRSVDQQTGQLMNNRPTNDAVFKHWQDIAGDRKTIIFCATVAHAESVAATFNSHGIATECLHGDLSSSQRQAALARYEQGDAQVITNVAVLTEGYDYPPTSCVVLLRLNSHKSTFLQMMGRGLRTVNPDDYPGVMKTDCIILDFGTSVSNFGRLETEVDLDGMEKTGKAPTKQCPQCDAILPTAMMICSLCGHDLKSRDNSRLTDTTEISDFVMTEVDLLNRSPFQWCDIFGQDDTLIATGFHAWAGLFCWQDQWVTLGGRRKQSAKVLQVGERLLCLAAADDWLNKHETEQAATKSKRWLQQPVTSQQLQFLPQRFRMDYSLSRYHASCLLVFYFNKKSIQTLVMDAIHNTEAA